MCLHFDRTLPTFESVNPTVRVQKVMLLHYCKKNDLILTLDICPNGIYFIALTPKPDSFRTASWAAQNTAGTGSTHLFLRSTLDDSQGHLSFWTTGIEQSKEATICSWQLTQKLSVGIEFKYMIQIIILHFVPRAHLVNISEEKNAHYVWYKFVALQRVIIFLDTWFSNDVIENYCKKKKHSYQWLRGFKINMPIITLFFMYMHLMDAKIKVKRRQI